MPLEPLAPLVVAEDLLGDLGAVDLAVRGDVVAELLDQLVADLAGREQLVHDGVARQRRGAEPLRAPSSASDLPAAIPPVRPTNGTRARSPATGYAGGWSSPASASGAAARRPRARSASASARLGVGLGGGSLGLGGRRLGLGSARPRPRRPRRPPIASAGTSTSAAGDVDGAGAASPAPESRRPPRARAARASASAAARRRRRPRTGPGRGPRPRAARRRRPSRLVGGDRAGGAAGHRQHLVLDALGRQRQPAALGVDLEDLHADDVALVDDLARVLDVVVGQLGDVHQALDAVQDLDERAERDDLRDLALELVAQVVGVDDPLPRILLGLLETQGDALAVAVDVEHLDRHDVADREDLRRVVDVRPGKLGDVDQAVDAVEVDERAEVDDVGDRALHDLAGLQPVEDLLADLLALLLEHRAARQHDVVARAVELDDLALDRLAEELVEVLHAADVDQRRGQEAAHAEVDDQAALDDLDDAALDGLARLGGGLDAAPCLLEARALLGHDQAAVLILLGEDQRVDLLAQLDLVLRVGGLADRELVGGDDPLALVADVDEDLVLVDAHDLAR